MTGRRLAFFLALWCAALVPSAAFAASGHDPRAPEILSIRFGFDGHYKVGYWTPIEVRLRAGTIPAVGTVEVVVPDCDSVPTIVPASIEPIEIDAGEERTVWLAAKIGRELEDFDVRFSLADGSRVTATAQPGQDGIEPWHALASGERLYLTLGGDAGIPRIDNESRPVTTIRVPDSGRLPQRWYGYDAVDAVIVVADDAQTFERLDRESLRFKALHRWVAERGQLLLSVGSAAREVLKGESPLALFAPGTFQDVQPLRRVDAIEKFADSAQRIPVAARSSSAPLEVARIESPKGMVVVEAGDLPLVVRSAFGFGEVVFVAFDLGRRPISDWGGRGKFIGRLLGWNEAGLAETNRPNRGAPLGFTDLSGQLHAALDQFDGVRVIPFWIVGLSIAGYVLLIGPVDYFVVHRLLKRPQLTWITFPTLAILVGGAAYAATHSEKSDHLIVNQVHLIDVESSELFRRVRGTSWANVLSPRVDRHQIELDAPVAMIAWSGVPGSAWGGMHAQQLGTGQFDQPYRFRMTDEWPLRKYRTGWSPPGSEPVIGNYDRLAGVPIGAWSSKAFVGQWRNDGFPATTNDGFPTMKQDSLDARLAADEEQRLSGEVTSRLDSDLKDCLLVYRKWAYPLGDFRAGERRAVAPESRRDLQSVLRGTHSVKQNPEQGFAFEAKPYDVANLDVPEILRQMMFYRAAEGQAYTTLTNDYQGFVDLSHQLELGRAVLVGQSVEARPPSWRVGEESSSGSTEERGQHRGHRWTFFRFIFDVDEPK